MQDNVQRSNGPAPADGQPEPISSGGRDEDLCRLFQSLFELTRAASERISAGDFSCLQEHLRQRGRILDRVNVLTASNGSSLPAMQEQLKGQLAAMLQSAQQENIRILQTIHERKKNVLSKIIEVQNRRHVFDYHR